MRRIRENKYDKLPVSFTDDLTAADTTVLCAAYISTVRLLAVVTE
jgi:hypothetical protein